MKFACTMWSNVWGGAFTENGRDSNIWPRGLKMTASSSRQAGVCYIFASNMSDTKKIPKGSVELQSPQWVFQTWAHFFQILSKNEDFSKISLN